MSKRNSGLAPLLAELQATGKLYSKADEAQAACHRKAARSAKAQERKALARANYRKYALQMDRLQAKEDRIIEKILTRPIASLADVQGLLQFMGRECQELVPCPSNDRQDYLTRSFDLLVVAVDKLAAGPAGSR